MSVDDEIRRIVREELRATGLREPIYSASHLPDGITCAESFATACRRARIDPKFKGGRSWRVPVAVWDAARARKPAKSEPTTLAQQADDVIDRMATGGRIRLVGGGR